MTQTDKSPLDRSGVITDERLSGDHDFKKRQKLATRGRQVASIPDNAKPKPGGGSYIKLTENKNAEAVINVYPPGKRDEMHCHNGDQTFHMIAGECTMSFPDGGKVVMTPGMSALITGGSFYQLDNSGDGPMVMMGTRSGHKDANQHILHSTRENKRAKKNAEHAAAHGQPVE